MSALTRSMDDILEAINDGAAQFRRALRDRQRDQADAVRDRTRAVRESDAEMARLDGTNPTGAPYRPPTSKGGYGETQTQARMERLGYERISGDSNPNANGVDDVFIHPSTGDVLVVESKYGTSRLGRLQDGTRQMSEGWLTNPFRSDGSNRLDHVLRGSPHTGGLTGMDLVDGLDEGIVRRALSRIDALGNVTIQILPD